MVDYLYKLYPDPIHQLSTEGYYPIHDVMGGLFVRDNPSDAIGVVRYLVDCDPHVKLQKRRGRSLLRFACQLFDDSDIETGIMIIKAIYDAHPEVIEDNGIARKIHHYHQQVQAFVNSETVYARQAKDQRLITTPDDNGRLPLHRALQNNVRLGSIKLLVKGNPSAIRSSDNNGVLPLHIACQHHESTSVVKYLVELDTSTLAAVDNVGNTALHYACRGARHEIIAMLLETYDAISVSRRNAHEKLPIDLLWESDEVEDRESIEYTESIFRLLTAYPETVMSCGAKQQATTGDCSFQNKKKRKLDSV